jgi:hypothetical protein
MDLAMKIEQGGRVAAADIGFVAYLLYDVLTVAAASAVLGLGLHDSSSPMNSITSTRIAAHMYSCATSLLWAADIPRRIILEL